VAGALPIGRPAQIQRMDVWHRSALANARYAPAMLPFSGRAGLAFA
jgi:hypothetical protein